SPAASSSAASASAAASGAPASSSAASGPAPKPLPKMTDVTISMAAKVENFGGVLIAKEFGEFEKENLNVTIATAPPSDAFLLLTQGKIQMIAGGLGGALLNLNSQKDSIRQIGFIYELPKDSKEGWWLRSEYMNADGS